MSGDDGALWVYQLSGVRLEAALPALLERVRAKGWRAVVRCGSPERAADLDRLLWIYRDDSFLPHGIAGGDAPEAQPIYLTAGTERPNAAEMLFLVDGAEAAPEEIRGYARCALIFDGGQPDALQRARAAWRAATTAGLAAVYYAEGPGGWEKKAERKAGTAPA